MTPAARISAAADLLDAILAGESAERALTNWGRSNRFAGSGDRAAVRDLVFDALRCKRSYAALGGAETGRGLMLGAVRAAGTDPDAVFTGQGHAPAPVLATETGRLPTAQESLDLPEWLLPELYRSLGPDLPAIAAAMRSRAPVFLRANGLRCTPEQAIAAMARDGIVVRRSALAVTALEVIDGARKIQTSQAYLSGLVELQDASSQAVVAGLSLRDGWRVLDLCAGGGGKTLAIAAQARVMLYAHDANPGRMRDLPARAARAGARVTLCPRPEAEGPFDLVLTDVPCSGSGSWRRDPQGKWTLTADRLQEIGKVQDAILDRAAGLVAPTGLLAYATCSLLACENEDRVTAFVDRTPGWRVVQMQRFTPLQGGDGFFVAQIERKTS